MELSNILEITDDLNIPKEYFEFTEEEKRFVLMRIIDAMLCVIEAKVPPYMNRLDILLKIINQSIETNTNSENYEMCCVLRDVLKIIDEA